MSKRTSSRRLPRDDLKIDAQERRKLGSSITP